MCLIAMVSLCPDFWQTDLKLKLFIRVRIFKKTKQNFFKKSHESFLNDYNLNNWCLGGAIAFNHIF